MIVYFGYFCAILIGLILGLTGGGGSILTVPVFVYILGLNPVTATAYSLFTVGTTSAVGTLRNLKDGLVDIKTGLLFAIPSLIGVFISRKFFISSIPDEIFWNDTFIMTKSRLLMLVFSIVIFAISLSMLRKKEVNADENPKQNAVTLTLKLLIAGMLVGFVGAGGGFLFTPLLLYVAKLPMKKAVATSLLMIAVNSLLGFTGDIGNIEIDWSFLLLFSLFSISGIFLGIYLNRFINEKQLKTGFAWFVMVVAIMIFIREFVF